jgi:hypothetical protein
MGIMFKMYKFAHANLLQVIGLINKNQFIFSAVVKAFNDAHLC